MVGFSSLGLYGFLGLGFLMSVLGADREAWKSRSIYFALTDRFAKTDGNYDACGNLGNYCGGTWKGMESRLDYISGLGFDAIWITPIVANTDGGYHGYWSKDLYSVNSRHGTADDLKSLIRAVHARGMYIMIDVVVNHMGAGDVNTYNPFNNQAYYHPDCRSINFNDQRDVELCRIAGLPDLKTEDQTVRQMYYDWIRYLVAEYSIDGLRLDTVKHVEKSFWPGFVSAAGVYCIGEVYNGDPGYVGDYQKYVDGILNFPMYYPINDVYARHRSCWSLRDQHDRVSTTFPRPELLGTFLDNHDLERFLSINNDWTLLKNALAYTLLARGIPILYSGTEQTYRGGNDPANREDLWRMGFNTNGDLYQFIHRIMAVKRTYGGLGDNDHRHLYTTDGSYIFSRAAGGVVVVTTNGGSGTSGLYCFWTPKPPGTVYTSGLGVVSYTVAGNGEICVQVSNGQPEVLVA